jgi:hypothetical protein
MTIKKLQAQLAETKKELAASKRATERAMRQFGKSWRKIYFKAFKDLVERHTDGRGKVAWDLIETSIGGRSRGMMF